MARVITPVLKVASSPDAHVTLTGDGSWHLEVPAGAAGNYRIAQIDDYTGLPRRKFPWYPPITFSLRARASAENLPGTWGFGLWNDPFSLSLGLGGAMRRFPALPKAAWFFHASPPNYLSLRDDLPAQGFLAATFRSASVPAPVLAALSPGLILFTLPFVTRLLRRLARRLIRQDAVLAGASNGFITTDWHAYQIRWNQDNVIFSVDGEIRLDTPVSPRGPLGLVLWIDNQYAASPPNGKLSFGTQPSPEPAWIDIGDIQLVLP